MMSKGTKKPEAAPEATEATPSQKIAKEFAAEAAIEISRLMDEAEARGAASVRPAAKREKLELGAVVDQDYLDDAAGRYSVAKWHAWVGVPVLAATAAGIGYAGGRRSGAQAEMPDNVVEFSAQQ
jgi:hypothetical protein